MKRRLAALLLLPGLAMAQLGPPCAEGIEEALRNVDRKAGIRGQVASQHCKPWPPAAAKVVAAVMAFERGEAPNRKWTGVLALVDAQTHRLQHSHRFEVEEDAVTSLDTSSLTLDTANYTLAPGLRALGLRYSAAGPGPSAADARSGNELTLFVPDGRRLRPVFGLSLYLAQAVKGCLGSCHDAVWDSATRTIAVGPARPQGWRDLRVTTTVVRESNAEAAPLERTPQRKLQVYGYTGKGYEMKSSQFDWDDYCCTIGWPLR